MKCEDCVYYADMGDGYNTCNYEDRFHSYVLDDHEEEDFIEDRYTYNDLGNNWW